MGSSLLRYLVALVALVLKPRVNLKKRVNTKKNKEGGVTAWHTMRLTELAGGQKMNEDLSLEEILAEYNERDEAHIRKWKNHFM